MVDNTVALGIRPLQVDVATPLMAAAKLRQAQMQEDEFQQNQKRERVGQAAADIISAPEGEQQGLWNAKITQGLKEGWLSPEDHQQLIQGYSPLRVRQLIAKAMPLKDYISYEQQQAGIEADKKVGEGAAGVITGRPPTGAPVASLPSPGAPGPLGRPAIPSSAKVIGDQEGIDRGIYEPDPVPAPRPRPGAAPAPVEPALAPAVRGPGQTTGENIIASPESVAFFARAMTSPRLSQGSRDLAKVMLEWARDDRKLTDEQKEYAGYVKQEIETGKQPKSFFDYKTELKRAGATAITNDMRGENAFSKTFGEVEAKRWGGYITDGEKADRSMVDITNMREISKRIGSQGAAANVKEFLGPYAEALGVNIEGLSDLQAYTSIVQRLAPQQRQAGSGSTSDIEFKGFIKSLPTLTQNPEAREVTLNTMEALTRHDQTQRDIAIKLSTGELTRVEAERAMRALPDPMSNFKAWRMANPQLYNDAIKPQAKAVDTQIKKGMTATNSKTGERLEFDGDKWVPLK